MEASMVFKYGNTCIAGDLNNNFHKFYIESNTLITENITSSYINKLSYRKNVVDFSIDIDINNNINIIYLTTSGILMHSIFSSAAKDQMVTKFNMNTQAVKYLQLKIVLDKINIFYMICSFENIHIWTLNHGNLKNHYWHNNIISNIYVSQKLFSYIVEVYKESLFILYSPNSDYYFNIEYYHNGLNKWFNINSKVYIENAEDANFFICPSGTGYIYCCKYNSKHYEGFIMHKNFNLLYEPWCYRKYISPTPSSLMVF